MSNNNPQPEPSAKETQKVVFRNEAHDKILSGAEKLAKAVASTMGPSGHSVIIDSVNGTPFITKDGVTVARSINLKDRMESMGAELLKEIASKTNDLAGDGTTTATVLGYSFLREGIKQIASGHNSIHLKKGMELGAQVVVDFLKENCVPVGSENDIINVGTISANGDREIGSLICSAIQKVGRDGIITIEPAKSVQTQLEVVEGMQLENGYVSPFFVTNSEKAVCELDNPYILLTSNAINSIGDIINVLERVVKADRPLLIIADDIGGDALHTLIVNKMKGMLKVCAVKAPSYGEHRADVLSDLATLVGGVVFGATNETSLKNASLEHLGSAKKIIVGRKSTVIVGDPTNEERKTAVKNRVETLRNSLATDNTLDDLRISKYRQRLAKLSGGIAIIKVGGATEVEILEKKDRVEDAVNATMAATQEGIVPGGGTALFYAAQALRMMISTGKFSNQPEDVITGVKLVANVCEAPLKTIVNNTGKSAEVVMNELTKSYKLNPDFHVGYNAYTEKYTNLISDGVIDPVKVTRNAILHSVSVVGLVLTCNAVVVNEYE